MSELQHIGDVRAVAAKALQSGGSLDRMSTVTWNVASTCEAPILISKGARPYASADGDFRWKPGKASRLDVDTWVRCRKCPRCLGARAKKWRLRAQAECLVASRTWFATLTLSPHEHYMAKARASRADGGWNFDDQSEKDQFARRVRAISPDITKWLKRIRKESGAPLRYLLVAEAHKSGLPHFHALVHEQSVDKPVRHATLRSQWRLGFSRFNLVEEGPYAARYVTKYLSKSALAKCRASVRYGQE